MNLTMQKTKWLASQSLYGGMMGEEHGVEWSGAHALNSYIYIFTCKTTTTQRRIDLSQRHDWSFEIKWNTKVLIYAQC